MNTFNKTSKSVGTSTMLLVLLWMAGLSATADTLTNVFSGNVVLDGDISDFFVSGSTNPLPGVCVTNDQAFIVPGIPGSEGLGESPSSPSANIGGTLFHPSGLNQRRIMSAYNPSLNGGTIFVGIDLPGGTNGIANPNYLDTLGPFRTGPDGLQAIRPFDADGNGEPDFIGRRIDGITPFSACPSPDGNDPDTWSCANESAGAIDDPRGRTLGEEEFYNMTISFGGVALIRAIFIVQNSTAPGVADLILTNTILPMGVRVSSSTGGTGVPLGFDVEFAVTNVNIAVTNECDRLNQRITIRSGSNSDGSGQGEDVNSLICVYNLPSGLTVTKLCPPTNAAPGTLVVFTGTVTNTGNITITNIGLTNVVFGSPTAVVPPVITTLAPGQGTNFSGNYPAPTNGCSVADTVTATGRDVCGTLVSTNDTKVCTITNMPRLQLTKVCPATNAVPGSLLVFSGTVTNTGNIAITNIMVVNNQPTNNAPVTPATIARLEPGQGTNFMGSYLVPTNMCSITDTLSVTNARDVCGTLVTATTNATCLVSNTPRLRLTKQCPTTNAAPGTLLVFTGTVTNIGNIAITNIMVVNNQPTNNAPVTPATIARLEPGQGTNFMGGYLVPTNSCILGDIVTASGRDICGTLVMTNATAECMIANAPRLQLTKACPMTNAAPGTLLVFTGTVTNTGNIAITNIMVVNNQPVPNTAVNPPVIAILQPGQGAAFTGSYPVLTNVCSVSDTLTVTNARDVCGTLVSATTNATCTVSNTPRLQLTKQCPPTNAVPGSLLVFTGTVTNTGNIAITNIMVVNDLPAANTPVVPPVIAVLQPGQGATFSGSYPVPTNACAVRDTLTVLNARDVCGTLVSATTNATCTVSNTPRLQLTKQCPPTNAAPGTLLVFTGTVTNTGNIAITNIMVVNNQPAPNTPVVPPVIAILQPGQGAAFSGSYPVPTNACSVSDTLTVINARDVCGTLVSATTNATCTVSNTPRLQLTKVCPATNAVPGTLLVFTGTVTNTGNIAITNIMVVNNQPGPNTPVNPAVIAILQPGQGAAFTGSYPVPTNACSVSDTLTVINARDVCGTLVSATTNATCTVSNTPRLQLTKACPATNAVPGSLLVFSGTVTNTGNIAITNIMVVNNQPGPNTPVNPAVIAILQPGQGAAFTGSYPVQTNVCSVSDTLTVINARDVCGTLVSATTNATCTVSNMPRLRLTKVCPTTNAAPGTLLVFTGTVTNTGNIVITNIMVVNDKPLPNTPVNPPLIAILQPGQGASFSGSYIAEGCGTNFTDTVTASGRDSCGNLVSANASATCSVPCPPSGGCRVTGGSNKQTNSFQAPCITTPLPSHISHGGQVGAPFSVGTPFTPNSPCISGEWQHNRHERNGNHLVGNFHASGNGHERQFDSLLCACLPCDENPNAVGVVGELCNPGDRICGPEPRRAPANKICFSGVGDYTFTNGRKTVRAVFRVDIEDRSEGNSHASSPPPDRYRIRLWLLDPSCGRNPDPNSAEAMALRFAASADPTKIASLATTEELKVNIQPDIDDGGNMTQGNHQIHPATGAQCGAIIPLPAARIDVATEIACMTPGSVCPFGIIAQGYQGLQDPAFAYRITITNCGTVTLTNLSVAETTDTALENTSGLYFAPGATLPPGGWVTRYLTNTWDTDTIYTVIVAGQSGQDGAPVVAASTAMASVSPADTQPRLSLQRAGSNFILQWPAETPPGFVLETTTNLTPPVTWSVITNANNPFVIPATPVDRTRFYRMRLP